MSEPQQGEGAPKRAPLSAERRRILLDQVVVEGERIEGPDEHPELNGWVDYSITFEGDDREQAMHGILEIKFEQEMGTTTVGRWALGYLGGDMGPEERS